MPDESADTSDKSWLRTPLTDSADIVRYYDAWAATYDAELVQWGYTAPVEGARRLRERLTGVGPVLDVGCGTGLTGVALRDEGVASIVGVDLSPVSLEAARATGAYSALLPHDFNGGPLPFPDGAFGAVLCVGVMSYALRPRVLIEDVLRVIRPGGVFVFTHRTDLWDAADFPTLLRALMTNGLASDVTWSEPEPYMPGNPDFADRINIRYVCVWSPVVRPNTR
jgi:SAM-dependent methyltransferase